MTGARLIASTMLATATCLIALDHACAWLIGAYPAVKSFALSSDLWFAMGVIVVAGILTGLAGHSYATSLDREN